MTRARYVLLSGFCGLAWAAALRGWMVQLAAGTSSFSWRQFPSFTGLLRVGAV